MWIFLAVLMLTRRNHHALLSRGFLLLQLWLVSLFHLNSTRASASSLSLGWGSQDVPCRKIVSLWIVRVSNALSSSREIVGGMAKLNVGPKREPIGTWFPKRHSHTASIHNSNPSDCSVKLHVGMTADD